MSLFEKLRDSYIAAGGELGEAEILGECSANRGAICDLCLRHQSKTRAVDLSPIILGRIDICEDCAEAIRAAWR